MDEIEELLGLKMGPLSSQDISLERPQKEVTENSSSASVSGTSSKKRKLFVKDAEEQSDFTCDHARVS